VLERIPEPGLNQQLCALQCSYGPSRRQQGAQHRLGTVLMMWEHSGSHPGDEVGAIWSEQRSNPADPARAGFSANLAGAELYPGEQDARETVQG
jgi:hypothetical protein